MTTGLKIVPSNFGYPATVTRLESAIGAAGMTVFARIDHRATLAAQLTLGPTELVIFGNAKGGTPLTQSCQTLGIDLPLKALVYRDTSGHVWVAYNDLHWIAERHGLGAEVEHTVDMMAGALEKIIASATSRLKD